MIGFHMHGDRHRAMRVVHHDPAPPPSVGNRSPFPWFVVAVVAWIAATILD